MNFHCLTHLLSLSSPSTSDWKDSLSWHMPHNNADRMTGLRHSPFFRIHYKKQPCSEYLPPRSGAKRFGARYCRTSSETPHLHGSIHQPSPLVDRPVPAIPFPCHIESKGTPHSPFCTNNDWHRFSPFPPRFAFLENETPQGLVSTKSFFRLFSFSPPF